MKSLAVACTIAALGTACAPTADTSAPADIIYVGDNIVTMDPAQPSVEAVSVRGEKIAAAGARGEVMALQGEGTRVIELGSRALLPGFIDAHGHFIFTGQSLDGLSLHAPPVGDVNNIDELVEKVRAWIEGKEIPAGETVFGEGYDDSLLEENRHPTRFELDRVSTEPPIVLIHVSGHLRAVHSAALTAGGVTADTPDPEGGHIRRVAGSREPNGVLEEHAGQFVPSSLASADKANLDDLIRRSIA